MSCWSQIPCCCEVQSTLTLCVWWRMPSDGSRGHVIIYMRHKSISRGQPLPHFPLLALLITLALSRSKQRQGRRASTHHDIHILGFPVKDGVSLRILAYWGLRNPGATWQLSDSSLSLESHGSNWVYRHEHSLLITTLSLTQTRNVCEWFLLQMQ